MRYCICLLVLSLSFKLEAMWLEKLNDKELTNLLTDKKVGYYIGSFDPLHLGHEAVIATILQQKLCDYIIVYPAWGGDSYKNRTAIEPRQEMLMATFASHPQVIVSNLNPLQLQQRLLQDGNSQLLSKIPGVSYIGIIGSDLALESLTPIANLNLFMQGIKIKPELAEHTKGVIQALPVTSFIVALRAGDDIAVLQGKIGNRPIVALVNSSFPKLSSTLLKARIKQGEDIATLINDKVHAIILKYKLYE